MHFIHILPSLVLITLTLKLTRADRVATYKEYKILDSPDKMVKSAENEDVKIYFKTVEKLDKLKTEAEDIRSLYRELMKSVFGITFTTTSTEKTPVLSAPRKASDDWVRATFDENLFNQHQLNQSICEDQ